MDNVKPEEDPTYAARRLAFIDSYAATFLAARQAAVYDDCCMQGDHAQAYRQPVEDAYYLAQVAWAHAEDIGCNVYNPSIGPQGYGSSTAEPQQAHPSEEQTS